MTNQLTKIARVLYPVVVVSIAITLCYQAHAGRIRKMPLSQEEPGIVRLALGHSTAISFPVKPEKLVLGSPTKVQVDFLGKDITVSPLAKNPGNLLVYTRGARYVILFQLGSDTAYDDVVEISPGSSRGVRPLRLQTDSYHVENFKITGVPRKWDDKALERKTVGSLTLGDKQLEGDELFDALKDIKPLRCSSCAVKRTASLLSITCVKPIDSEIRCESPAYKEIKISRGGS